MKPASFKYLAPKSVIDILAMLAQHGENAKILAGGQSLVPVLNFRLGRYDYLIDINRVDTLSTIRVEGDWLRIGALTRQRAIETSDLIAHAAPLLSEVTKHIAHVPIRTRGTIGGSISHADPAAEDPAAMLALDAEFDIESHAGCRTLKAVDFFLGPMQTGLEPHELLTAVRIPIQKPNQTFAFDEVSRRRGDYAIIGVAVVLSWQGKQIVQARIAACGLESGAVRLEAAERELEGTEPSSETVARAARAAARAVSAQDDLHATSEYRRHLIEYLVQNVVARAQPWQQ